MLHILCYIKLCGYVWLNVVCGCGYVVGVCGYLVNVIAMVGKNLLAADRRQTFWMMSFFEFFKFQNRRCKEGILFDQ